MLRGAILLLLPGLAACKRMCIRGTIQNDRPIPRISLAGRNPVDSFSGYDGDPFRTMEGLLTVAFVGDKRNVMHA